MDILNAITTDNDLMRDWLVDLELDVDSDETVRRLSRLMQASWRAKAAALYQLDIDSEAAKPAQKKATRILARMGVAEDVAHRALFPGGKESVRVNRQLFMDLLERAAKEDEKELLPLLHDLCSDEELHRLGDGYARYRDIALCLGESEKMTFHLLNVAS